jgi:hypothetical protein
MRGRGLVVGGAAALGGLVALGCATVNPADELVKVPQAAAHDSSLGRCPETKNLDIGSVNDVVEQPGRPAARIDNGVEAVARDDKFRVIAIGYGDEYQNVVFPAAMYVTGVAIIDTTGHPVKGSLVITRSDGVALSHGLCEAFPHMVFHPAKENGRKVRALYRETFVFYRLNTQASN